MVVRGFSYGLGGGPLFPQFAGPFRRGPRKVMPGVLGSCGLGRPAVGA
jgi:hypothetical protein